MEDDPDTDAEERQTLVRLNAREQTLAAILIGLALLVFVLALATWFL